LEPQHRPNDEGEQYPWSPRETGNGGAGWVRHIGAYRGGDASGRASPEGARGGARESRALEGHGVGRRGRGGWGRVRLRSYGGGAQGGVGVGGGGGVRGSGLGECNSQWRVAQTLGPCWAFINRSVASIGRANPWRQVPGMVGSAPTEYLLRLGVWGENGTLGRVTFDSSQLRPWEFHALGAPA
jgi:hypothetical protein